jgi:hypothetical protein
MTMSWYMCHVGRFTKGELSWTQPPEIMDLTAFLGEDGPARISGQQSSQARIWTRVAKLEV